MNDLETIFTDAGGEFNEPPIAIRQKLETIKAFLFDWDGVFNDGRKDHQASSGFSEGNAMGINMLRFSVFLLHGFNPKVFVVTGETNPSAIRLVEREHFDGAFFGVKNKVEILPVLKDKYALQPEDCAFVFDDILDLSLAEKVGVRFFIRNKANPLLIDYILEKQGCEYISGHNGGDNGLRECCELIIGLNGNFQETIDNRVKYSGKYRDYLEMRNTIQPCFYKATEPGMEEFKPVT